MPHYHYYSSLPRPLYRRRSSSICTMFHGVERERLDDDRRVVQMNLRNDRAAAAASDIPLYSSPIYMFPFLFCFVSGLPQCAARSDFQMDVAQMGLSCTCWSRGNSDISFPPSVCVSGARCFFPLHVFSSFSSSFSSFP